MTSFEQIAQKVENGERLSEHDAFFLFQSVDLFLLGELADLYQRRQDRALVSYDIVYGFSLPELYFLYSGHASYFSSALVGKEPLARRLEQLGAAVQKGATEVYIAREAFQSKSFSFYLEVLTTIKELYPKLSIRAFNVKDISFFSRETKLSFNDVLLALSKAGLNRLADISTQIFSCRKEKEKNLDLSKESSLLIHKLAHSVGLGSSVGMPYVCASAFVSNVKWLKAIRDLQDTTKGFTDFNPYPCHFYGLQSDKNFSPSAVDDLKIIAISRLFLDNIRTIQADWTLFGPDIAQIATSFGANKIGSVWLDNLGEKDFFITRDRFEDLLARARKTPRAKNSCGSQEILEPQSSQTFAQGVSSGDLDECDFFLEASIHFAKNCSLFSLIQENNKNYLLDSHSRQISCSVSLDLALEDSLEFAKQLYLESAECYEQVFYRIDLSPYAKQDENLLCSWETLILLLKKLKIFVGSVQVALSGFQFIWQVAQAKNKKLVDIFCELSSLGVNLIESSSNEFEGGLTNSEIIELHKQAHLAGLSTTAKLELSTRLDGKGFLWKSFLSKLNSYVTLQKETSGVKAFKLEPAYDASMTMYEFLYAISLTKYFLVSGNVSSKLMTPLRSLPALNSELSLFRDIRLKNLSIPSFTQKKLFSLLGLLGVDDIGAFDFRSLSENILMTLKPYEKFSGCSLILRDVLFDTKDKHSIPLYESSFSSHPE